MRDDESLPPISTAELLILHASLIERQRVILEESATRQAGILEDERHSRFAQHLDTIKKMIADGATDMEIAKVIDTNSYSLASYLTKHNYRPAVIKHKRIPTAPHRRTKVVA